MTENNKTKRDNFITAYRELCERHGFKFKSITGDEMLLIDKLQESEEDTTDII